MTAVTSSAPQSPSSTPGEVERLVGVINEYAEAIRMHERSLHRSSAEGVEAAAWWWARWQQSAQSIKDILSHISTAGRGKGSAPDWIVEFVRSAANTVAQTTLPGSALREVAERAFAWAVIEGQTLSAADATNPQDQE